MSVDRDIVIKLGDKHMGSKIERAREVYEQFMMLIDHSVTASKLSRKKIINRASMASGCVLDNLSRNLGIDMWTEKSFEIVQRMIENVCFDDLLARVGIDTPDEV